MRILADFHIHSKYSRATSGDMDLEHLNRWAGIKGINLMATGDFTHPQWLQELKDKLDPAGSGLFKLSVPSAKDKDVYFMLTTEVCNIFVKKGKSKRIHNVIFAPALDIAERIARSLGRFGSLGSDGRPMLDLSCEEMTKMVLDISPDCFIVPGHIWTPHFSLFGSNSGFNEIEECFGDQTKNIHCLETGLSSDPAMNWRLSKLDRYTLISNSDSHSPKKIGREANLFDCQMSYFEIIKILKTKDKKKFLSTIEFFPEEGKYHYDGHRQCKVVLAPQDSKKNQNLCPVCGRKLTIGVLHRVDDLADRAAGTVPARAIPFHHLIPLSEIIGDVLDVGPATATVEREYYPLVEKLGNEFDVLLKASKQDLLSATSPEITQAILNVREGKVKVSPGYDGVYGQIEVSRGEIKKDISQLPLF